MVSDATGATWATGAATAPPGRPGSADVVWSSLCWLLHLKIVGVHLNWLIGLRLLEQVSQTGTLNAILVHWGILMFGLGKEKGAARLTGQPLRQGIYN